MLKEAGVPYYVPTAKELGCAQEALDKSRDPFGYNPRVFPGFPLGPAMQQFAST
jgi:hypothetical protein